MAVNQTGLSRDLIIHPGETLSEVLEERQMSQKELSLRTGMSEKHISNIVSGKSNISTSFANKLEYALDIDSSFWINLQSTYDNELCEYNDVNKISDQELNIANSLKKMFNYFKEKNSDFDKNESSKVVEMRKVLGVSNLTHIPGLASTGAWFRTVNTGVDLYSSYAWVKLCEFTLDRVPIENELDTEQLRLRLPEIKAEMHKDINLALQNITEILSQCGISFGVFKSFKKVPIQGFIKCTSNNTMLLCMTIRQKFADIFWFTLFHEIGHILNGDATNGMIDYTFTESEFELAANEFAANMLINSDDYKKFVLNGRFDYNTIKTFAAQQDVLPCIVIGRLQKEKYIPYQQFANKKVKYSWID